MLARAAPDLAAPVAGALAAAAAGNPLALLELPATLRPEQRTGRAPLDLPLAPGERLHAAFARRIGELPAPTRRALLVAAVHQGDDLATIAAACTAAGADVGLLAHAEAGGLVRLADGRLAFGHPLIRGSVDRGAGVDERRGAHREIGRASCRGG